MSREEIINAIVGFKPSYGLVYKYEQTGLLKFTGCTICDAWDWVTQDNPAWDGFSQTQLMEFYDELKEDSKCIYGGVKKNKEESNG